MTWTTPANSRAPQHPSSPVRAVGSNRGPKVPTKVISTTSRRPPPMTWPPAAPRGLNSRLTAPDRPGQWILAPGETCTALHVIGAIPLGGLGVEMRLWMCVGRPCLGFIFVPPGTRHRRKVRGPLAFACSQLGFTDSLSKGLALGHDTGGQGERALLSLLSPTAHTHPFSVARVRCRESSTRRRSTFALAASRRVMRNSVPLSLLLWPLLLCRGCRLTACTSAAVTRPVHVSSR
ncbi:hypothetical protein VFPFJ_07364 [Purpureocillium lilacinum]|uniref:Uncharacterized protein n=1 Tax=Purpureocillium lilacinum TaxID=33203 RepID=A0A179HHF3_PURLI|nr:hypothetical protein VFPFJ_07364 [Purpureocillium lilacinum]OAQ88899.1 hypothetical protein VFPFJ_07364 [Purpureocillium lilacinum]